MLKIGARYTTYADAVQEITMHKRSNNFFMILKFRANKKYRIKIMFL